jgi:DNA-binding protein Fis
MGCGCKNKNNGGQPNPQPVQSPQTQNASNNQTIQESIRKVVDKYYKNKR